MPPSADSAGSVLSVAIVNEWHQNRVPCTPLARGLQITLSGGVLEHGLHVLPWNTQTTAIHTCRGRGWRGGGGVLGAMAVKVEAAWWQVGGDSC